MSTIVIEREHRLGCAGAREQAQHLAERLAQKYKVSYHWDADTLLLQRRGAQGSVQVDATRVYVKLKLGVLLAPLANIIKAEMEQALDQRLG